MHKDITLGIVKLFQMLRIGTFIERQGSLWMSSAYWYNGKGGDLCSGCVRFEQWLGLRFPDIFMILLKLSRRILYSPASYPFSVHDPSIHPIQRVTSAVRTESLNCPTISES